MPIERILDISTAHMKSTDAKILDAYSHKGRNAAAGQTLIAYPYGEYGWTISTAGWNDTNAEEAERRAVEARGEGFSDAFIAVIQHAVEEGLVMVRFDRDASYEPSLPSFDWEGGDLEETEADRDFAP